MRMFPTSLYLTWHGIGPPHAGVSPEEARYWNPVAVFSETLTATAEVEGTHGLKVFMTFDDGNESDFTEAFEQLVRHDRTGIFFVCASRIDQPNYLSAAALRTMHAAGMMIGSHGFDHIDWSAAPENVLAREFTDARSRIEDVLGASVDAASVPFGMVDRRVAQWAINAGFTRLFTSSGGFATGTRGLIPRNSIINGFNPATDLQHLTGLRWRARSALRDPIRRLRYWSGAQPVLPVTVFREKPVPD
jgi:peptidoglycan/xylan/chitin deacetylase (PgdA/CDA1 family)